MGILKIIADFIGGKDPENFDKKGEIFHQHPKKKWQDWDNRFSNNSEYDWKQHSGASHTSQKTSPKK